MKFGGMVLNMYFIKFRIEMFGYDSTRITPRVLAFDLNLQNEVVDVTPREYTTDATSVVSISEDPNKSLSVHHDVSSVKICGKFKTFAFYLNYT